MVPRAGSVHQPGTKSMTVSYQTDGCLSSPGLDQGDRTCHVQGNLFGATLGVEDPRTLIRAVPSVTLQTSVVQELDGVTVVDEVDAIGERASGPLASVPRALATENHRLVHFLAFLLMP